MESNKTPISKAFDEIPAAIAGTDEEQMWRKLKAHFYFQSVRDMDLKGFIGRVQLFYQEKTGRWLCKENGPLMAHIGMPILCHRLVELRILEDGKPHFTIPVDLHPGDGTHINLQLPYEIIPELEQLKLYDYQLTVQDQLSLDFERLYFLSTFHYKNHPEVISLYSLDVEAANDRHYQFSKATAEQICILRRDHPKAIGRVLRDYLACNGGPALERLIYGRASATFHY